MSIRTLAVLWLTAASFFILSCGGGSTEGSTSSSAGLQPPSGPIADFSGNWKMLGTGTAGSGQGVLSGQLEVDAQGTILCGIVKNVNGTATEFTGGKVYIDDQGCITGSIESSDGAIRTIIFGRMEPSHMFASFIASGPFGQELFALVRDGGNYEETDFISGWHLFGLASGTPAEGSLSGDLDITGASDISGSYTHPDGSITHIQDGSLDPLSLTLGRLEGALDTDPLPPLLVDGFLSRRMDKGFIDATSEAGALITHYFYLFIKSGGVFTTADLAGTWSFVAASAGGTEEGVSHGSIEIDASGAVRGGSRIKAGVSTAMSGGSVAITDGIIAGTAEFTDGGVINITSGKMDPDKSTLFGIDADLSSGPSLMIWFKQS